MVARLKNVMVSLGWTWAVFQAGAAAGSRENVLYVVLAVATVAALRSSKVKAYRPVRTSNVKETDSVASA